MEVNIYKRGDYINITYNILCQYVFFDINKNHIIYKYGFCKTNNGFICMTYNDNNEIENIEKVSYKNFNENKYINQLYFIIKGGGENFNNVKLNNEFDEHDVEIDINNLILFYKNTLDYHYQFIQSSICLNYAKAFLKYKNEWNKNILKNLPAPSYFSNRSILTILNELDNSYIKYKIESQTYKWYKDPKFIIPLIISLGAIAISIIDICLK